MTWVKRVVLVLFCLIAGTATQGRAQSAGEMLSYCREVAKAKVTGESVTLPAGQGPGVCWGAFGTVQSVIYRARVGERPFFLVCAPAQSTRIQLITNFVKYADGHQDRLRRDFFDIAVEGLQKKFPCPNESNAGRKS
jgi:hypothetical protein